MAARQKTLAGMEEATKHYPAVSAATEVYIDKRDARMALLAEEVEAREALRELMVERNLSHYTDAELGVEVTLMSSEVKLKAKRLKHEEPEAGEEE